MGKLLKLILKNVVFCSPFVEYLTRFPLSRFYTYNM